MKASQDRWLLGVAAFAVLGFLAAWSGHYGSSLVFAIFVVLHLAVKLWCVSGKGPAPVGISYLCYGGSRAAVTDPSIAKELSRYAVQKADQRLTFAFCGGHHDGILSSKDELWERHRRLVHAEIAKRTPRFFEAARAVAAELSRGPPPDGSIELLQFFGPRVSGA